MDGGGRRLRESRNEKDGKWTKATDAQKIQSLGYRNVVDPATLHALSTGVPPPTTQLGQSSSLPRERKGISMWQ